IGPPVRVLAAVLRSHRPGSVLGEHTPMAGPRGNEPASPTEMAARDAYDAAGVGEMTGRLPVNPSGGLLSKGEPLGASALGQIVELTWQLRGAAEKRQVDAARLALAHTVGRGANASVVILAR